MFTLLNQVSKSAHKTSLLSVETLYRQVEVDYQRYENDGSETIEEREMTALLNAFRSYASSKQSQVEWDKIESIPLNLLVNILSMNLDFNPIGLKSRFMLRILTSRFRGIDSILSHST